MARLTNISFIFPITHFDVEGERSKLEGKVAARLKWVNTEWKQVADDQQELQIIPQWPI